MSNRLAEQKAVIVSEALRLDAWNPFSGESCEWFDPEWMFGIRGGFDIVIGEPPYIQMHKFYGLQQVKLERQQYQSYDRMGDIYYLFYEKGHRLLAPSGLLCFITSDQWMRADQGTKLREFFSEQTMPLLLVDFGNVRIFYTAIYTNILFLQEPANPEQKRYPKQMRLCRISNDFDPSEPLAEYVDTHSYQMVLPRRGTWLVSTKDMFDITPRIEKQGIPLKEWNVKICQGIATGYDDAFVIDRETKERLVGEDPRNAELLKPVLTGKDIKKMESGM